MRGSYAFVDELAALRSQIVGAGNLERFDYWLNNFRCLRSIAEVRCVWARFNAAMAKVRAEKTRELRNRLARESALPLRKQLVAVFGEMQSYLLATVSNAGELGNVCNWQQQTVPAILTEPGLELTSFLGEPLPADAQPYRDYAGPPRIIVPTVRTGLMAGETLKLTVLLPGIEPREAALYWRRLGRGDFVSLPLVHGPRNTYHVALPPDATRDDLEYYIRVDDGRGRLLHYPAVRAEPQSDGGCSTIAMSPVERMEDHEKTKAYLLSEERYRSLFEQMTEGFALHEIICDEQGQPCDYRFLDINPAFEQLTGLKRSEVIGKTVREILPGEDPRWIEVYGAVALTGQSTRFESQSIALHKHYDVFAYRPARASSRSCSPMSPSASEPKRRAGERRETAPGCTGRTIRHVRLRLCGEPIAMVARTKSHLGASAR